MYTVKYLFCIQGVCSSEHSIVFEDSYQSIVPDSLFCKRVMYIQDILWIYENVALDQLLKSTGTTHWVIYNNDTLIQMYGGEINTKNKLQVNLVDINLSIFLLLWSDKECYSSQIRYNFNMCYYNEVEKSVPFAKYGIIQYWSHF